VADLLLLLTGAAGSVLLLEVVAQEGALVRRLGAVAVAVAAEEASEAPLALQQPLQQLQCAAPAAAAAGGARQCLSWPWRSLLSVCLPWRASC
jgi:hypothetical protein